MKTTLPKIKDSTRGWVLIDAEDKPLGRLAVKIADILRGKDKCTFTPHIDTGAFVIVINAEKVKLTGKKEEKKTYQRYSGYRSGLKVMKASEVREKHPERMLKIAVEGMLPGNNLARAMFRRLKVYAGVEHPHKAQNPRKID